VLGVLALAPVLLTENAVIGMPFGEQPPHRRLRRPIGDRHRIEGPAVELVFHVEPLPEVGQDRPAGDVGHLVEEGDEIGGGREERHGGKPLRKRMVAARDAPKRSATQASRSPAARRAPLHLSSTKGLDFCAAQNILCCIAVGFRSAWPFWAFPP